MQTARPRILVVDDEEPILETMTFTFQSDYEVFTSTSARKGLEILDENAPFAAVLTDQRMPDMSGVEFVSEVCKRHPATTRMILTGFSDVESILQAINDGHVYAYITKPWEPDHLKQVMKQAVDHNRLSVENERLLTDVRRTNLFLEAVMDELDTGALALDAQGVIRALNRPVRDYLGFERDPLGLPLIRVLEESALEHVGGAAFRLSGDAASGYEEVDVRRGGHTYRVRITSRALADAAGEPIGRVILLREVSHEPLRRQLDAVLRGIASVEGALRPLLDTSRAQLTELAEAVRVSGVESGGMNELAERISRTLTALENWLEVDEVLATQDFPDAQLLQDRMRIAQARWPIPDELPQRVQELARRVEDYHESGEHAKQHVL